jgi:hypothetical protein
MRDAVPHCFVPDADVIDGAPPNSHLDCDLWLGLSTERAHWAVARMVRRGSTVRVRQMALRKCLQMGL